jgi:hypothetical protein
MSAPKISTVIGQIHSLERLKNSVNGNPRYRILLTDGYVLTTAPDAMISYNIDNREFRDIDIKFTLDGRGNVYNAETL